MTDSSIIAEAIGVAVFVVPLLGAICVSFGTGVYVFFKLNIEHLMSNFFLVTSGIGMLVFGALMLIFGNLFVQLTETYPCSLGSIISPFLMATIFPIYKIIRTPNTKSES